MKASQLITVFASLAVLAGCGGAQTGSTGVVPQGLTAQARVHRASASSGALLYASHGDAISIFTYPAGKHVATFVPPLAKSINGLCSDASGNVFVVTGRGNLTGNIYEYAHGATSPTRTVSGPSSGVLANCATETDPPQLAVATTDGGLHPGILFYNTPSGGPTFFEDNSLSGIYNVTFMDSKNIFALCQNGFVLVSLPSRGSWSVQFIAIKRSVSNDMRFIQWDGSAVGILTRKTRVKAKTRIQQIQVANGQGTILGTTEFNQLGKSSGTTFALHGSSVVVSMSSGKHSNIGIYPYPEGGDPENVIQGYSADLLTVSVAPSH